MSWPRKLKAGFALLCGRGGGANQIRLPFVHMLRALCAGASVGHQRSERAGLGSIPVRTADLTATVSLVTGTSIAA
eukprot:5742989-Pleurochrysis_carterae.AAC.1